MIPPLAYTVAEACVAGRTGRTALYEATVMVGQAGQVNVDCAVMNEVGR
jgi:hypothetical protein